MFRREVQSRVEEYLRLHHLHPRDLPGMYRKTIFMFAWWGLSYGVLMLANMEWWAAVLLCISFGMATSGVGFNVMHDANHDAYSNGERRNRFLGLSVELIGISSFVWRQQHNVWHHTYTNVSGLDEGLEASGLMRWSPYDRWKPWYRYQHVYWPLVYAVSAFGLMTLHNFRVFLTGRSGPTFVYPRMTLADRALFLAGRLTNLSIYILIPLLFFEWYEVLIGFGIAVVTAGMIMATILQLSHVMRTVEFVEPSGDPLTVAGEWAVHQVEATIDFGGKNRFLTWYVGGLNYQIEHHLFPRLCHLHYPRIAPIVRQACAEYGVSYRAYPTFLSALREHVASLRWLGSPAVNRVSTHVPAPVPVPQEEMSLVP